MKWVVELSLYDITYKPRTTIKSQALADFIAKLCIAEPGWWTLEVDGASNARGGEIELALTSPGGLIIEQTLDCDFLVTNNEAEYEVLIAGLKVAQELRIKHLKVRGDSQLTINQILGSYQAKDERMKTYLELVQILAQNFDTIEFEQIPTGDNSCADALAAYGSAVGNPGQRYILQEHLEKSAISSKLIDKQKKCLPCTGPAWNLDHTNIKLHKKKGNLPSDRIQARKIRLTVTRYIIINGNSIENR